MKLINNYIAVVMPVYNRTDYLEDAIGSVLNQAYNNYNLIIVDDGSTNPKIKNVLNKYSSFNKIRVFYNEHGGPGRAINFGARKVRGEYFCRLDSDDLLTKDALEILNKYINQHPDVSYFYSSRYLIDSNNNIIIVPRWIPKWMDEDGKCKSIKFDRERLLKEHHCNPLICWKKIDFSYIGGMSEHSALQWIEDYELALRMSDFFRFQNIDEGLYMIREYSPIRLTDSLGSEEKKRIIKKIQKEARERRKNIKDGTKK